MTANDADAGMGPGVHPTEEAVYKSVLENAHRGPIMAGPPMEIIPPNRDELELAMYERAWKTAQNLAKSDLLPKHFHGKPHNVLIGIRWSQALRVPIELGLQYICVINKRPSIYGDLGKAILLSRRGNDLVEFKQWFEGQGDNKVAYCSIIRDNPGGQPIEKIGRFSLEQAKTITFSSWEDGRKVTKKLIDKDNWRNYPDDMLEWRAFWRAMRGTFPELLCGLYPAEEIDEEMKPAEARVIPTQDAEGKVLSQMERAAAEYGGDREDEPVSVGGPGAIITREDYMEGGTVALSPEAVAADPTKQPDDGPTDSPATSSDSPSRSSAPDFTTKNPPKRAKTGDTWQTGGEGPVRVLDESGVWLDVDAPDAADVHDGMGGVWVCDGEPVMMKTGDLWAPGSDPRYTVTMVGDEWVEGDEAQKVTVRWEIVRRCHALSPRPIAPEGFTDHDLAALYLRLAEGSEG